MSDTPYNMEDRLARLEAVVAERRIADPASSYVASLAQKGRSKMAQKLGEEATETVIAAIEDNREEVVKESADLLFHLACLLADMGLSFTDILAELDRREGTSGLVEKAARPA